MDDMYILTDARNFTTCCRSIQKDLYNEVKNAKLIIPIFVVRWKKDVKASWEKIESFSIPGERKS